MKTTDQIAVVKKALLPVKISAASAQRVINAALNERERYWQQVAEAHDCASVTDAFVQLKKLRQQLAVERDDRISWQELYEKTNEQVAAERKKSHQSSLGGKKANSRPARTAQVAKPRIKANQKFMEEEEKQG